MVDHSMKVAGIDTGKSWLHVCLLPGDTRFKVANGAEGHAELASRCRAAGIVRAGIEATSIYHCAAAAALRAAGIEVAELQPRQSKAFARALLQWSKSDDIDCFVIARLAQALAAVAPGPDPAIVPLAEALTFIEQLEDRIVVLKTSLERYTTARFKNHVAASIKLLEKQRKSELRKLEAALRKTERLARRLDLLLGIPALAERTALGMLIRMPELGSLTREQAARLAGLAPTEHDSGQHRGVRHIYGGRARLRKTVFMAAFAGAMNWNEDLKAFYARLRAKGKAHTAAIIACARKLVILANAVLQRQSPWQPRQGTSRPAA